MQISVIAAIATNGVIGRNGALPWHLSGDLQRFKRLTMGHTIIMGRRTWESIGRPLPGRRTIVVTRRHGYCADVEGVQIAESLDDALHAAEAAGDDEAFIVGGAQLYQEAVPMADCLYLTEVAADVDGDTYFPINFDTFDWDSWITLETEAHDSDSRNDFPYIFVTLRRCERNAGRRQP